ncbi:MAG: histidine ammonia-lyase [Clostridiaceae bacterium]|jgi:histidine ammonia-lyase|nr:histidine ammonia-lyase [Clostridiaceae bacterium]
MEKTEDSILIVSGHDLTTKDVYEVAAGKKKVALSDDARRKMQESFELVKMIAASGRASYGISTGFGEMSKVYISEENNAELQHNLIVSHACGVGEVFSEVTSRAIMLLRLNTLASGYSGVNPQVTDLLLNCLNANVLPLIPQQGSLGASGDLANLAHMALLLIGEGRALCDGLEMPAAEALARNSLQAVKLSGKDGLALINGTTIMTAVGTLALLQAEKCLQAATAASALSFEALHGFTSAYDERIHALRQQEGQIQTARYMRQFLQGSEYANTRLEDVQDPYTLRCIPQVHGASMDAINYVYNIIRPELNAVTDNPLVFVETGEVISGGNFHGQPLALALDFLAIATSELANISERRIERLVNPQLSGGLPAFLTERGGLNSGLMIPQYTAASLVSENKVLAHPASVDSIPSSANKEDHVSMGAISARKAIKVTENVLYVIAIELIAAAQGLDLQEKRRLGRGTQLVYDFVREYIPFLDRDRVLSDDIIKLKELLSQGALSQVWQQVQEV